jgi:hypothetical protein
MASPTSRHGGRNAPSSRKAGTGVNTIALLMAGSGTLLAIGGSLCLSRRKLSRPLIGVNETSDLLLVGALVSLMPLLAIVVRPIVLTGLVGYSHES